jgi:hypothetical protein
MSIQLNQIRDRLQQFDFARLFIEELGLFPLTPDPVKVATLNAYRDVERGLIK